LHSSVGMNERYEQERILCPYRKAEHCRDVHEIAPPDSLDHALDLVRQIAVQRHAQQLRDRLGRRQIRACARSACIAIVGECPMRANGVARLARRASPSSDRERR
jgi:hypothetical protein